MININFKNNLLKLFACRKLCLLVLLLNLFSTSQLWSTTYYLDYTNGDNSNDGLSSVTPWKDLFKIRASFPKPGDVYLFKFGEKWEGLQMYITDSGTATQPITYGAYGNPMDGLPIISAISSILGADDPLNWIETSANLWTFSLAATPGRLFLDDVEYLRASVLDSVGMNDSQAAFGHWFYDVQTNMLTLHALSNPANLYTNISGSKHYISTLVSVADHILFENLDFRGGWGAALGLYACQNIEVKNCSIGHSANSGILVIDFVTLGVSEASSNITIKDNSFDSNFTFYYGIGSERGCGDGIKLTRGVHNCLVYNNNFKNWAHNAIELEGTSSLASGVHNNQFYDNYISAPDLPYAHPLGADGFINKCTGNEFYRNYIENCRTASQINGNNNWVHHNIIVGMRNSPSKTQATAYAFILAIYGANLVSQNNRFDHNLIIDTDEAGFLIRGYGLSGQTKDNIIRNNILYETSQNPYNSDYAIGTGIVIYDTSTDGVGANTYQNNLFYNSISNSNAVYNQDADVYYSSTQFNAQNGVDGNLILANIDGDPLFTNFANKEYLPLNNSPVIDAGTDTGLPLDYVLNNRFVGLAPDIGPFERAIPLAVEFGNFSVKLLLNSDAQLFWETYSETNNSYFEIERSLDLHSWKTIALVTAQPYVQHKNEYSFIDKNLPIGLWYYRLKQVDIDGQFSYSSIVNCRIEGSRRFTYVRVNQELIRINPNGIFNIKSISIFDSSGKLCLLTKESFELNLNGLASGIYFLIIEDEIGREVFQFVR